MSSEFIDVSYSITLMANGNILEININNFYYTIRMQNPKIAHNTNEIPSPHFPNVQKLHRT